jgi:hypothetical protein
MTRLFENILREIEGFLNYYEGSIKIKRLLKGISTEK